MISFLHDDVFLIVGLGNPGPEYFGTRHNFGFSTIDFLSEKIGADGSFTFIEEIQSEIAQGDLAGKPVCLLKPWTFMNRSGIAVQALLKQQRNFNLEQMIVVHDDLDLDLGRIKLKLGGGSGGHNGLKSLIEELGSSDFLRLRLGVGNLSRTTEDTVDFVLAPFSSSEQQLVDEITSRSVAGIAEVVSSGITAAMNLINRRVSVEA